jgi:hypothetical protein
MLVNVRVRAHISDPLDRLPIGLISTERKHTQ